MQHATKFYETPRIPKEPKILAVLDDDRTPVKVTVTACTPIDDVGSATRDSHNKHVR